MFDDVPVLCGHRGAGSGAGENTLGSFRAAVAAGLPWVEVDARLTADGELVALHDPNVADGRELAGLTAAEAGLMRVADLLDDLPPQIGVDVEIKTAIEDALRPRGETTAARVAELAAAHAGRRRLLVTSFDPGALPIVREHAPAVATGLITWRGYPLRKAIPAAVHLGADVVVAEVESFEPGSLDRSIAIAHAAGLQVAAWCPAPAAVELLVAAGVDCLVVDAFGAGEAEQARVRSTRGS